MNPGYRTGGYNSIDMVIWICTTKMRLYRCDCTLATTVCTLPACLPLNHPLVFILKPRSGKKTMKQQELQHNIRMVKSNSSARSRTRRVWSQDPVQKAVPSGETRSVLTRFSCPNKIETRVPFRTSQTLMV